MADDQQKRGGRGRGRGRRYGSSGGGQRRGGGGAGSGGGDKGGGPGGGGKDGDGNNRRFRRARPRRARGGIKARTRRGAFGQNWWAKRWIEVLENLEVGGRLLRGRSYARSGQVVHLEMDKGSIEAHVQGSRSRPYVVRLRLAQLERSDWKKLTNALREEALYAAKLLAGEMPEDIEEVFRRVGLSLFPNTSNDLRAHCSCPDWSNPCKHIAAVYYLLGEEFDRDPFLLFKLRGMERADLIAAVGVPDTLAASSEGPVPAGRKLRPDAPEVERARAREDEARERVMAREREALEAEAAPLPPEPLSADVADFWTGGDLRNEMLGEVRIPPVAAALPKRLGSFPFWHGEETYIDAMERVYHSASPVGMEVFLGEGEEAPPRE